MSKSNNEKADTGGESTVSRVNPQNLEQDAGIRLCEEDMNLDMLLDIPVTVSVEVGNTRMNIRDLLQLNQGSVIELDRKAGDPLDIKVNGTLIARGEVVVINERFGIRLTDIISPAERVRKLR